MVVRAEGRARDHGDMRVLQKHLGKTLHVSHLLTIVRPMKQRADIREEIEGPMRNDAFDVGDFLKESHRGRSLATQLVPDPGDESVIDRIEGCQGSVLHEVARV